MKKHTSTQPPKLGTPPRAEEVGPPVWSARLKHHEVDLIGRTAKRTSFALQEDVLVMGNRLPKETPSRWAIRVVECGIWSIFAGVSLQKSA